MLETIVELGKQGASQKMIWSTLGISKSTADAWRKSKPEFAEALDVALVHSQAFWEAMMLANVENRAFNSRMVEIAVRGQFPSDYKDRQEIKAEVKQETTVNFAEATNDLIKALKAAAENQ